jgi:folate-dependent phosphoribosylglycinamide formyltransferase PurN
VLIRPDDTAESLADRVNEKERLLQSVVLNDVVNGRIFLGDDEKTVFYPRHYPFTNKA